MPKQQLRGKTAERLLGKVKPDGVFASVTGAPANAKDFRSMLKLAIRLPAVGGDHSIPAMGDALRPYFQNVTSMVVADPGHFVPEEH